MILYHQEMVVGVVLLSLLISAGLSNEVFASTICICIFVYLCICVFVSTALFNEVFLPFNAFQFLPIITNPIQLEEEDDEVMIDPRYS